MNVKSEGAGVGGTGRRCGWRTAVDGEERGGAAAVVADRYDGAEQNCHQEGGRGAGEKQHARLTGWNLGQVCRRYGRRGAGGP